MIILIFLVLLVPFVVGGILTLATQELEKNKKNKTYIDKLMEDKEFRKRFDEEYQNLCKKEYQCEHAKNNTINAGCVWCNLALADKTIEILKEKNDKLLAITDAQVRKIKSLEGELEDWRFELAYFTDEDIATPEGVRTFICKNFLNDKTVDEINKIKLYIKELKEEIKDRADTEKSLTVWVEELGEENDKLKLYIAEIEDDFVELCYRMNIEEPALYRTCSVVLKPEFKKKLAKLIKKYKNKL